MRGITQPWKVVSGPKMSENLGDGTHFRATNPAMSQLANCNMILFSLIYDLPPPLICGLKVKERLHVLHAWCGPRVIAHIVHPVEEAMK